MLYYSTSHKSPSASLEQAVVGGLAPDGGLYMPEHIAEIPKAFFKNIGEMSFHDIAYVVANTLFGDDIGSETLKGIVNDTLSFDIPLKRIEDNRYVLELFHGPTMAFKDVGARFMARLLSYFNRDKKGRDVNVLVATSGDTGSAVANGFLGVPGVKVYVLYPKGKVSAIQESQFTTLGQNITALEVCGTFDDCQALVKEAFVDKELNDRLMLTSANSINIARFLPQMFYYFYAYAQLAAMGQPLDNVVVAVPSGNFGNITSALIGKRMGLPINRFIAANNRNNVFYQYLLTGKYQPRKSIATIANAMDVGAPSNFERILDLYGGNHDRIASEIAAVTYDDPQIRQTMAETFANTGYILDPHGAVAYRSLTDQLRPDEIGIALETAHPAKFKDIVEDTIGQPIALPKRLAEFSHRQKSTIKISPTIACLKRCLLS